MALLNYEGLQYYHDKLVAWIKARHNSTKTSSEVQQRTDDIVYFTTDTKQIIFNGNSYGGSITAEDVQAVPKDAKLAVTAVIPIVDCRDSTSASFTISPNKKYLFGTKTSLYITLETPTNYTIVNGYSFEFTSGATATTLSMPSSIKWLKQPSIKANKTYQVFVENNLAVIGEWSNV